MGVIVGTVGVFAETNTDKSQALKVVEETAKLAPRAYMKARGMNPEKTERIASMMADLVRRAKALSKAGE